jgi:hypothetical protein
LKGNARSNEGGGIGVEPNNPSKRSEVADGGVDEKTTAKDWTLFKRTINGNGGLGNDVSIVNVGGDADDAVRRHHARLFEVGPGRELQDRIRPIDMPIDGILIGEHALCESLADDNDGLFITIILILVVECIEVATGDYGNAKRRKKSRRDDTPLRARIFYTGGMGVTLPGELKTITAFAPRNHIAECCFAHARQSINAAHRFLVADDSGVDGDKPVYRY